MGKLQAEQFPFGSLVQTVGTDGDTGHFLGIRDQLAEMLWATYPSQALIAWKCPILRLI